ncbi:MAG: adenylosuccinate lyase [Candidatus Bathyarchaeia archaeon]
MPIHPIEYRYGSAEMKAIFDRSSWLEKMLRVEAALAEAHAEVGDIPVEAAEAISKNASLEHVTLEDIARYEREIGHEVMCVVKALSDASRKYGGYVHLGATSADITDSVLALQVKEALEIIRKDLVALTGLLADMAEKYRDTICLGRTHGVAALPMPFGFKFAVWASEARRHLERLDQAEPRICRGKMSGAVGTMAGLGRNALRVQELTMKKLGLQASEISTQVVPRDGLAEFIGLICLISSFLEKMANEVRNLQRTEIREVEEPFEERSQVGSSTMPHKRNPEKCEKVCGLARIIRGYARTALENTVLEHERDLTNSSCERAMVPEACILLDEQLKTMLKVMRGLIVYPENMRRNIDATRGLAMSEAAMLTLAEKGPGRQWAHELIRRHSMEAWRGPLSLAEVLKRSPEVTKYLTSEEIDAIFDPKAYLGTSQQQIEKVVADTRLFLKTYEYPKTSSR